MKAVVGRALTGKARHTPKRKEDEVNLTFMSHTGDASLPNTSRLFLINSKYSWITYVSSINYEIITISGTVGHCVLYVFRTVEYCQHCTV